MGNKSSLENVLKAVLSVGNAEQNFAYPPNIFENHFNIVTSFILDKLAISYPSYIEALLPFLTEKTLPVKKGVIQLDDDFRNLLGAPSISMKPDGKECGQDDEPIIKTQNQFDTGILKSGCKTYPVRIIDKKEWDYRTTSEYNYPTHEEPIGLYVGGKQIKICPYDISQVKITYVRKENIYRYGYIQQPDDTFIYDKSTSVESEWEEPAFELLFKGAFALYSAYSKDNSIMEYSALLNQAGLF